jgi:hypothetical protein
MHRGTACPTPVPFLAPGLILCLILVSPQHLGASGHMSFAAPAPGFVSQSIVTCGML